MLDLRALAQDTSPATPPQDSSQSSSSSKTKRASAPSSGHRRIPGQAYAAGAAMVGMVQNQDSLPLGGATVTLEARSGKKYTAEAQGDGIYRIRDLPAGAYKATFESPGYETLVQENVAFQPGEIVTVEIRLHRSGEGPVTPPERQTSSMPGTAPEAEMPSYRELSRRVEQPDQQYEPDVPSEEKYMRTETDRWNIAVPDWQRFSRYGEYPYITSHWYDPFNRNILKADKPVLGQYVFFNLTGSSTTSFDTRRLYIPSGVSANDPGSRQFFGRGGMVFLSELVRLSFDLFHGDTTFKPVDWRIKITPAFNVNQLWTHENGIVDVDVRQGTDRTDQHIGFQEAFVEKKIANLGPNYDFISVRAGIQQFNSDFRGLLFINEQPGLRVFGNLLNNRMQYNAAYFYFLEKDTNSGLNTLHKRGQQVIIGNVYYQDFLTKGYTIQMSYHFNKDDADLHFDNNGFLVRPAPIGAVTPHNIRASYIGITGNGHIGRINVSNAFYQALGHDDLNPISGRFNDINAQFAALELSLDKDWIRFRTSAIYSSGDSKPRDRIARGFSAISESESFAGGIFSFFNREGIRLTGTGVGLVSPDSFIPDLKSSKDEGQTNFVNPGLALVNVGADFDLTPTIRVIGNFNYMRFVHTQPLELLLFQSGIKNSIGFDYSAGIQYRPPLTENFTIIGGISALTPGTGLKQIYTGRTLISGFVTVRFLF